VIVIMLFIRLLSRVAASKCTKNHSTSNQVGNTFQTLFFWSTDIHNSFKH